MGKIWTNSRRHLVIDMQMYFFLFRLYPNSLCFSRSKYLHNTFTIKKKETLFEILLLFFTCVKLHSEFLAKVVDKGGQSFSGIMKKFNVSKTPINTGVTALPQEIDWRSKGAVTPVKDASKCQHPYCSAIISMVRGYLHPYTRYNVIFKSMSVEYCLALRSTDCPGVFESIW